MILEWDINKEYGFLDILPREYDEAYFKKYEEYAKTPMGNKLTEERISFVNKWCHPGDNCNSLLDIGVGSGCFIKRRNQLAREVAPGIKSPSSLGYDINPVAVEMLKRDGLYVDIAKEESLIFSAYTFWDSFEHIKDHSGLFNKMYSGYFNDLPVKAKVFMSIPIFRGVEHALGSKHFRVNEHYWYFTAQGLIRYMSDRGFACLGVDDFENRFRAGREDILSFVFGKR